MLVVVVSCHAGKAEQYVARKAQPVEKVFCRALQNSKMSHTTFSNADSHLLRLSILVFQQAGPLSRQRAEIPSPSRQFSDSWPLLAREEEERGW